MDTILINTKNSKTSEPHKFRLYFTDKLDLRKNKTVALASLSIYYISQNIKDSYNNNKFKISARTWNEAFDLPNGSYTIEDIQGLFLKLFKNRNQQ